MRSGRGRRLLALHLGGETVVMTATEVEDGGESVGSRKEHHQIIGRVSVFAPTH